MDENMQQNPQPKKTLIETVAICLREDINVPHNLFNNVELCQPPINDDDHDSWASSGPTENWYWVAKNIIDTIDRYRAREEKTITL